MMITLGLVTGVVGCFLLLWTLGLRRMSVAQRPRFASRLPFRLGVPMLGTALVFGGVAGMMFQNWFWGTVALAVYSLVSWLALRHDQYSAMARILYDDYRALKTENPKAQEFDLLYSIVKSRYPRWQEDRIMEVCAGKDIKQLILLLLVIDYEIHPLNDMALYVRIKATVESLAAEELP